MSASKRYFPNMLPDYEGGPVSVPKERLRQRCWEVVQRVLDRQPTNFKACDGGLYVGVAGTAYACLYVASLPSFSERRNELLERASQYMGHALAYCEHPQARSDRKGQSAFLLGSSGVYAVAALLAAAKKRQDECDVFISRYLALLDVCMPVKFLSCGSDELLVGRAGYLSGLFTLNKQLGTMVCSKEKIHQLCDVMIQSGREYAKKHKSLSPLMYAYYNTEYLGAAHGLSGILQMLLSAPDYLSANPDAEKNVKEAVNFMLSLQTPEGNFPGGMDELPHGRRQHDELVHWCHGAPGVVYLMAKAYQQWHDERFLQSCLKCGELVWKKGLLCKGPGICHGVAGSGYVFLLLYRLTNDPKHLHRALQFADFLFTEEFKRARTPDAPYSLYEGLSGTACFLADVLHPETAHFPFFDVF